MKIIGILILLIAVGVTAAVIAWNNAGNPDYYTIGKDKIPSVKLALGEERKMSGTSSSAALGGGQTKEFRYQVSGSEQNDDMFTYLTYLREKDGFLLLTGFDFNGPVGSCLVGRNSVDDGYEIQLQIEYDRSGYTITILKQAGGITPNTSDGGDLTAGQSGNQGGDAGNSQSPGSDSSGTIDTGNTQSPVPDNSGPTATGGSQSPAPDNSGPTDTGSLTKGIFDIVDSGTHHMVANFIISSDTEAFSEIFVKDGMTAVHMDIWDTTVKFIEKDGKKYTVIYDYEMIVVEDADPDDDIGYNIKPENMVFIGEGSGDFRGKTYRYDEYRYEDGDRRCYFVDGGALVGIRTISGDEIYEVEVFVFDKNVPDDAFDYPEDFEIGAP